MSDWRNILCRLSATRFHRVLAVTGVVSLLAGCAGASKVFKEPMIPPRPSEAVQAPPPPASVPESAPPELPGNWEELAQGLTLADIIDIGLTNNPNTRATWLAARAAAAQVGIDRADYLPKLDLDAEVSHITQSAVGGRFSYSQNVYGASATFQLLLFDFGGRSAKLDEAWAGLLAANWAHNAEIQNVVLAIEAAYYSYLDAKALLVEADATIRSAEMNLDAARKRHEVGVATIADVLQAQTSLSRAKLARESLAGQIEVQRGVLATTMGIPANTAFDLGTLPAEVKALEISEAVESLIEKALAGRPDLAQARWQTEQAASHLRRMKAEGLPTISATAFGERRYYFPGAFENHDNNWSAALLMHFPLFTGFAHTFDVKKAEAEFEASQTQVTSLEQQVILEVWNSYADLKTAAQRIKTSRDLVASAEASNRVSLAQYKQGVGDILDLLTTQASLALARAQEIESRSDWFLALARLARATGSLEPTLKSEGQTLLPKVENGENEQATQP
jgi:outer membrane protein